LHNRQLQASGIAEALRHIGVCEECADRARDLAAPEIARVQELLAREAAIREAAEPPRHCTHEELFAYVDGAPSEETSLHIDACDLCRSEAIDLKPHHRTHSQRRWMWVAAAAAAAGIVLVPLLRSREKPPPALPPVIRTVPPSPTLVPAAPRYSNPDWVRLVDDALESGHLPFPRDLAQLRGESEALRGDIRKAARLDPRGIVIDDVMPAFTWPHTDDATYVVLLFEGEEEVAHSEPLTIARWRPAQPLRRGRTYAWQVEARTAKGLAILPSPPDPPARFRIVSAQQHEELAAALRLHPDDHLLLSALYARAGLEREAKEHLRRIPSSPDHRIERLKSGQ